MAVRKCLNNDMTTDGKINEKKAKIRKLLKDAPKDRLQFAEGLIYQFAVTAVTLERLADEINNGDVIEVFKQGAQEFRRENPAIKSYNATMKSFIVLSKSLLDLMPDGSHKRLGDELMNFATQPPGARSLATTRVSSHQ